MLHDDSDEGISLFGDYSVVDEDKNLKIFRIIRMQKRVRSSQIDYRLPVKFTDACVPDLSLTGNVYVERESCRYI